MHRYSNATMKGCNFTSNQALNSGGAIHVDRSHANITTSDFHDNQAFNNGGSILVQLGQTVVRSCTFNHESATTGYGGSISGEHAGNAVVINSSFSQCTASYGGSISILTESTLIVQNSNISRSFANYSGGGIYVIQRSSLIGNGLHIVESESLLGGAMFVSEMCNATLKEYSLINTTAKDSGGALNCGGSNVLFEKGVMMGNHGDSHGGGIFAEGCEVPIDFSVLNSNSALRNGGFAYGISSVLDIHNSKALDNTAEGTGHFLQVTSHSVFKTNFFTYGRADSETIVVHDYSIAEINHTNIGVGKHIWYKNRCQISIEANSHFTMTFLYSKSKTNRYKHEGENEVCVDGTSHIAGIPEG